MWHFLNANLANKSVLILHPLHSIGDEIGVAFRNAGGNVHVHAEIPAPDCVTLTLHPSGRHDVIVICHNHHRLSSTRLAEYASAYAPYLAESGGTLIFALLNEACAIHEHSDAPNPIKSFARATGEAYAHSGIRINVIARHAEPVYSGSAASQDAGAQATLSADFPEIALFLASPLNTYITGQAFAADV